MNFRPMTKYTLIVLMTTLALAIPSQAQESPLREAKVPAKDLAGRPDVVVAAAQLKPFITKDQRTGAAGPLAEKIIHYLQARNLNHTFYFGSWIRVVEEVHKNNDVLIANLIRTPEREGNFHWLMPLQEKTEFLVVKKGGPYEGLDLKGVLASDGVAVCLKSSVQCDRLRAIGFPASRIRELVDDPDKSFASLIVDRRFAFWIKSDLDLASEALAHGIDSAALVPLFEIGRTISYLAAPNNIDPEILAILIGQESMVRED